MASTTVSALPRPGLRGSKRLLSVRDDDHLVARTRAGEVAAFEVLYERHVPGVLSFSRHMLGSRDEAEDAVQQAFASAHRDLLARDREIDFKPWIYTIARNRCLSMLRARHEHLPDDRERATAGLDAEVQSRADLRELVADLQDLPEDQRAALLLSEVGDLSHAQIADILECKVGQVKGLVH
nr:sigma-70 family RNA polymerase sigma factor [Thermoleophilaceae bacterium]